jgi:hypothetical protein
MLCHVAVVRSDISEEHILRLLVTANAVPSLLILVILMMEVMHFPETSVLTRIACHNIPEDSILHNILYDEIPLLQF